MKALKFRSHDKAWFNKRCHQLYIGKHTAYNLWFADRTLLCWDDTVPMRNIATNAHDEASQSHK